MVGRGRDRVALMLVCMGVSEWGGLGIMVCEVTDIVTSADHDVGGGWSQR